MRRQTTLPRRWLMTDERIGDRLWAAIERLPAGDSGILFRYYSTRTEQRAALAREIAEACRQADIVLAIARNSALAEQVGADLVHNPAGGCRLRFSRSVHNMDDADAARRSGASLVFVSPVHATRSHPGQAPLGVQEAVRLAEAARVPAVALGGMDEAAFAALPEGTFHGWAGIDAWIRSGS